MSTSPSEMKPMLFFIVDNMNRGANLIEEQEQRYEVSQLNLEAGEKALSTSAFHSATKYLNFGLSLLGPESWEMKYELTIRLYDAGESLNKCFLYSFCVSSFMCSDYLHCSIRGSVCHR